MTQSRVLSDYEACQDNESTRRTSPKGPYLALANLQNSTLPVGRSVFTRRPFTWTLHFYWFLDSKGTWISEAESVTIVWLYASTLSTSRVKGIPAKAGAELVGAPVICHPRTELSTSCNAALRTHCLTFLLALQTEAPSLFSYTVVGDQFEYVLAYPKLTICRRQARPILSRISIAT